MVKVQHERDKIRRPCIAILRTQLAYKQLNRYPFFYWTCPPDHGKQTIAAARGLKLDGYEKGVYDLTIIAGDGITLKVWLIEFKYGDNPLTKEQAAIWEKSAGINGLSRIIIKSPQEFEDFLKGNFTELYG